MNWYGQTSEGAKFGKLKNKKLLGIVIYCKLRFDEYNLSQCKKAGRKLSVLVRICKFMTIERRMLMKVFIESQFGYCRLAWMCCNRSWNNRINYLHERALRIVYNAMSHHLKIYYSCIHHRKIRLLVIELYKTIHNSSSHIVNELF